LLHLEVRSLSLSLEQFTKDFCTWQLKKKKKTPFLLTFLRNFSDSQLASSAFQLLVLSACVRISGTTTFCPVDRTILPQPHRPISSSVDHIFEREKKGKTERKDMSYTTRISQVAGHLNYPKGMLAGQVAIITGSGQGIGAECARLFANEGAKVVVNDIDESM